MVRIPDAARKHHQCGREQPDRLESDRAQGQRMAGTSATGYRPEHAEISVDTRGVPPGSYTGSVLVETTDTQVADATQYITVKLTVLDGGLVVVPEQVTLWQVINGAQASKEVAIERGGVATAWVSTAVETGGAAALREALDEGQFAVTDQRIEAAGIDVLPGWLVFTPDQGTTPAKMMVKTQGNTPGVYHAIIFIVAKDPDVPNRIHEVHVTAYFVNRIYRSYLPLTIK